MSVVARKTKRGGTVYYVYTWVGGRQLCERAGTDKREAQRLDARRTKEKAAGELRVGMPTDPATTLGRWVEEWVARRSNRDVRTDRSRARVHILPSALAAMQLREIQTDHVIEQLDTWRSEGASVSHVYSLLRTALRDAKIARLIPANPCLDVPRGKIERAKKRPRSTYDEATLVAMLNAPSPAGDRILVELLVWTGQRLMELARARWKDVDWEARPLPSLTIEGRKTGVIRRVPMHPVLVGALLEWRDEGFERMMRRPPGPEDYLAPPSPARSAAKHHTASSARRLFRRVAAKARVKWRDQHTLRHTFISRVRRNSSDTEALERVTHNAVGAVIDQYTHWEWEPLCAVVLAFDATGSLTRSLTRNHERAETVLGNWWRHRATNPTTVAADLGRSRSISVASDIGSARSTQIDHSDRREIDSSQFRQGPSDDFSSDDGHRMKSDAAPSADGLGGAL